MGHGVVVEMGDGYRLIPRFYVITIASPVVTIGKGGQRVY